MNVRINDLNKSLDISVNNEKAYSAENSALKESNIVFRFELAQMTHMNDSILVKMREVAQELKIKDKKLKEVASVETIISDTITQEIPVDRNFTVELKPNQLTTIKIARIDSMKSSTVNCNTLFCFSIPERALS